MTHLCRQGGYVLILSWITVYSCQRMTDSLENLTSIFLYTHMYFCVFLSIKPQKIQKQLEHHVDWLICRFYSSKVPVQFIKIRKGWQRPVLNNQNCIFLQQFISLADLHTKFLDIYPISFCVDLSPEKRHGWQMSRTQSNFQMLCFKLIYQYLGDKSSFSLLLQIC